MSRTQYSSIREELEVGANKPADYPIRVAIEWGTGYKYSTARYLSMKFGHLYICKLVKTPMRDASQSGKEVYAIELETTERAR